MQEFDLWSDANVIGPLFHAARNGPEVFLKADDNVKKAIRQKLFDSYRNGQQVGLTKPARKEPRR